MLTTIDTSLFYFINRSLASDLLDFIMPLFARHEDWFLVFGVAISIMLYADRRKGLFVLLLCGAAVAANDATINFLFKPLVARVRPCGSLPAGSVRMLVSCGESFSFPSQHAANMFVIASVIGWKYKRIALFLFTIAGMVAISRVYLGVHFPLDVTGGALVGILWGAAALYGEKRVTIQVHGSRVHGSRLKSDED